MIRAPTSVPTTPPSSPNELPAHHHLDETLLCDLLSSRRGDPPSVPQDGTPLGNLGNFGGPVRDVDNGHPSLTRSSDDFEKTFVLHVRQCGGQFVEEKDAWLLAKHARNLGQLLLGHVERADEHIGIDRHLEQLEVFRCAL